MGVCILENPIASFRNYLVERNVISADEYDKAYLTDKERFDEIIRSNIELYKEWSAEGHHMQFVIINPKGELTTTIASRRYDEETGNEYEFDTESDEEEVGSINHNSRLISDLIYFIIMIIPLSLAYLFACAWELMIGWKEKRMKK